MQFIHTADWHIGFLGKSLNSTSTSYKVSEARFLALEALIKYAKNYDFILMAGDVFEDHAIDSNLIGQLSDILKTYQNNIYFISGNHDPFGKQTSWNHPSLQHNTFKILNEAKIERLPDGNLLFAAPIFNKISNISPLKALLENKDIDKDLNLIRIGLTHGDCKNIIPNNQLNHPIDLTESKKLNLDYLALGHWHGTKVIQSGPRKTAAYAGTHEPQKFEEINSGNFLAVTINNAYETPKIEIIKKQQLFWEKQIETVNSPEYLKHLIEKFDTVNNSQNTLIQLQLNGFINREDLELLTEFKDLLKRKFLYTEINDNNLNFTKSLDEKFLQTLDTALQETARELLNNEDNEITKQAIYEFLTLLNKSEDL